MKNSLALVVESRYFAYLYPFSNHYEEIDLLISALILISCQRANECIIKGTVVNPDFEGTSVYLQGMTDDAMVATNMALLENGSFTFRGVAFARLEELMP